MTRSVAVVGGGAVGVTAAYDLAKRGADVTLFERDRIAGGSTGRAAGVLYDAYAEDVDAKIGQRAIERFRNFSGEDDFKFHPSPYVWFATERGKRADAIREEVGRMQRHDLDVSLSTSADLEARYPALDLADAVVVAVAQNAGTADTGAYAELLADKASDAGAALRIGEAAELTIDSSRPRVNGEHFDAVVVAAGAHTKQVLAATGIAVPLKPYRVQALTLSGPAIPAIFDATAGYYARPHPAGILAGDGTVPKEVDPDKYDPDGDDWFVDEITGHLQDRIVNYTPENIDAWAGLCVATPDRDPLLGEIEENVYVAAGWQGHGFMRAPATGELIAEQVLGGDGVDSFDPTRFTGDEDFEIREGMEL